jgi:hypothetical protein
MIFPRFALALVAAGALPAMASAQSPGNASSRLVLELNTLQDTGTACRLTFLARNETGATIDQAVFETVIFDTSGGVVSLSLFDFRDLPADRPRVRQFDVPGIACGSVGKALINGASTCLVEGTESMVCQDALSLESRLAVEFLG